MFMHQNKFSNRYLYLITKENAILNKIICKRFCLKLKNNEKQSSINEEINKVEHKTKPKVNYLNLKVNNMEKLSQEYSTIHKKETKRIMYSNLKTKIGKYLVFGLVIFLMWVSSGFYDVIPRYNIDTRVKSYLNDRDEMKMKYYSKKD